MHLALPNHPASIWDRFRGWLIGIMLAAGDFVFDDEGNWQVDGTGNWLVHDGSGTCPECCPQTLCPGFRFVSCCGGTLFHFPYTDGVDPPERDLSSLLNTVQKYEGLCGTIISGATCDGETTTAVLADFTAVTDCFDADCPTCCCDNCFCCLPEVITVVLPSISNLTPNDYCCDPPRKCEPGEDPEIDDCVECDELPCVEPAFNPCPACGPASMACGNCATDDYNSNVLTHNEQFLGYGGAYTLYKTDCGGYRTRERAAGGVTGGGACVAGEGPHRVTATCSNGSFNVALTPDRVTIKCCESLQCASETSYTWSGTIASCLGINEVSVPRQAFDIRGMNGCCTIGADTRPTWRADGDATVSWGIGNCGARCQGSTCGCCDLSDPTCTGNECDKADAEACLVAP